MIRLTRPGFNADSYLFTPYTRRYAPLHLLHVLDSCIYHMRNHGHVKVFSFRELYVLHTTKITAVIVVFREVQHLYL